MTHLTPAEKRIIEELTRIADAMETIASEMDNQTSLDRVLEKIARQDDN